MSAQVVKGILHPLRQAIHHNGLVRAVNDTSTRTVIVLLNAGDVINASKKVRDTRIAPSATKSIILIAFVHIFATNVRRKFQKGLAIAVAHVIFRYVDRKKAAPSSVLYAKNITQRMKLTA